MMVIPGGTEGDHVLGECRCVRVQAFEVERSEITKMLRRGRRNSPPRFRSGKRFEEEAEEDGEETAPPSDGEGRKNCGKTHEAYVGTLGGNSRPLAGRPLA